MLAISLAGRERDLLKRDVILGIEPVFGAMFFQSRGVFVCLKMFMLFMCSVKQLFFLWELDEMSRGSHDLVLESF